MVNLNTMRAFFKQLLGVFNLINNHDERDACTRIF